MDQPVRVVLAADVGLEERLRTYAPAGEPHECWEWTRATNKGYGMISIGNGKLRGAHIVAWELHHGRALPARQLVRHTCDNPPCTNPAHLLVGNHPDNSADKVARNRQAKGEAHGLSKITAKEAEEIRYFYESGVTQREIGQAFGISQAAVSLIINRKTWC